LTELLVHLREYFLEKNLTRGEKSWVECEIKFNVHEMKLGVELKYEN